MESEVAFLLIIVFLVFVVGTGLGHMVANDHLWRRLRRMSQAHAKVNGPYSIEFHIGYVEAISDVLKTDREFRAKEVGQRLSQVGQYPNVQTGGVSLTNASTFKLGGP